MQDRLTQVYQGSSGAVRSPQEIQIRLDTAEILQQIYADLSGIMYVQEENKETGKIEIVEKRLGESLANDEGIRCIMAKIHSIVNRAVVQGNISNVNEHNLRIANIYEEMTDNVYLNLEKWGISENYAEFVIELVVDQMDFFLTRLIGDKERDYLTRDSKTERTQIIPGRGISLPGLGKREEGFS